MRVGPTVRTGTPLHIESRRLSPTRPSAPAALAAARGIVSAST